MKVSLLAKFAGLSMAAICVAFAQGNSSKGSVPLPAERPAIDALRRGDLAKADALLQAAAAGVKNSPAWRLSYAEQLMAAAIDLQDRYEYKLSTEYFRRAADELLGAVNSSDATASGVAKSRTYETLAFIARTVDSDVPKANAYLKQALALDPKNQRAREALQRTTEGRKELEVIDAKAKGGG